MLTDARLGLGLIAKHAVLNPNLITVPRGNNTESIMGKVNLKLRGAEGNTNLFTL